MPALNRRPATRRERRERRSRRREVARSALGVATFVLLLFLVWPSRFGGDASFVVIHGTSMEPEFHAGDVVYARDTRNFAVGDLGIYRVPDGAAHGDLVVHRVVDIDSEGRFLMKGDNRPAPDGVELFSGDMVAKPLWNLGPLPIRLLLLMPFLCGLVISITAGWYLWPRSNGQAEPVTHDWLHPSRVVPASDYLTMTKGPNATKLPG